jgi:hypothetical protein
MQTPKRWWLAGAVLFALQVFLLWDNFTLSMRGINLQDEAIYINLGRMLASEGQFPALAQNPLVAALYAILYLFHAQNPLWMNALASWGHFLNFSLLWWGTFAAGLNLQKIEQRMGQKTEEQTTGIFPVWAAVAALFIFPITTDILINSSDALFAGLSALAFGQVLRFYENPQPRHLAWASALLGLSALTRNDGLVIFGLFTLALLAHQTIFRLHTRANWLAVLLPFALIVGGYQVAYGFLTGNFRPGTTERSYAAFQQGQYFIYEQDYLKNAQCGQNPLKCAVADAHALYGTPEENNASVFRAILRNPSAYQARLLKQLSALPEMLYTMFGKRTAPLLLFFAPLGILALIKKRRFGLFLLASPWVLYLGTYFLTFFRPGYFQLSFFVPYLLTALGAVYFVQSFAHPKAVWAWSALLGGGILWFWLSDSNLVYVFFVLALLLLFTWLLFFTRAGEGKGLLLLLTLGILLARTYQPPSLQNPAQNAEEQGILLLTEQFPAGTLIMAGAPGAAWAARMDIVDANDFSSAASAQELREQLLQSQVQAIWVDSTLTTMNRHIWALVEPGMEQGWYETLYSARNSSVLVLRITPLP